MNFTAELKEAKGVKSASLDLVYSLKLITEDPQILDLAKLPSDTLLKVTIEPAEGL